MPVRIADTCNAHAMSREARASMFTGFSFGALQQAFSSSGVPGVTWAMRLHGQDTHRKGSSPAASACRSLPPLSQLKRLPKHWPTRGGPGWGAVFQRFHGAGR